MSVSTDVSVVCPKCENQEVHSYRGPYKQNTTCNKCSTEFTFLFAKIRSKKSRGNRKDNSRQFDVRIYLNDDTEKFIQFEKSGWDDIELRSKDMAVFSFLGEDIRIIENKKIGSYTAISKPSCFIATYLYGPYSKEVAFLRGWRDSQLAPSFFGAKLVNLYYAISPFLLRHAGRFGVFKKTIHFAVHVVLKVLGYKHT